MVMEIGAPLGSTKWTSTVPWPFAPAPGAARLGEMHTSGFAVTAPGADEGVTMDFSNELVTTSRTPFTARREPVGAGEIPSMVVRFRFTDRATLTKERLDVEVADFLKKAGYKVSRATSFKSVAVTWRWQRSGPGSEFYFPVVATPADLAGLRYAGSALTYAEEAVYEPTDAVLAKMPNQIYIYTIATTSAHNTMSDGEAAVVITLLKQAMINIEPAGGRVSVETIVRGCPLAVFQKPIKPPLPPPKNGIVKKVGWSALILVVAYNMIAPHIGSEVL